MTSQDLRHKFLKFFQQKGHTIIPSASLVPEHDPTVLFTTAGMHPLIPYLLGEPHPGGKRLANVQKCLRTDDIDEVGDAVHGTFFEMLGNWSLGDPASPDGIGQGGYWKKEAISWSLEFLTTELKLPREFLAVSIFAGDDDAPRDDQSYQIWTSLGICQPRIKELGKKDNWWGPVAKTGPCGPDTEMFYWTGAGPPPEEFNPDDKQWVEIWNNVFMEFAKQPNGKFVPLSQKNVDTGMGLERILMVLQKTGSIYQTDVYKKIYQAIEKMMTTSEIRFTRIIADHLRASCFLIADGVVPANTDRGYILRRLIRRAVRSARRSGIENEFTASIAKIIIEQLADVYGELNRSRETIFQTLIEEEARFQKPINWLAQYRQDLQAATTSGFVKKIGQVPILSGNGAASGRYVFENYQTYGVPPDLAENIIKELGLPYDKADFDQALAEHQSKSRSAQAGKFAGGLAADHSEQVVKGHTATHLLHQALKTVLGDSVHQTGSNINSERIRFDFSFDRKLTENEVKKIEDIVNSKIQEDLPVHYEMMPISQAKEVGAIGLFDKKYGDIVKVYFIGDYSREFCGGPHVEHTGLLTNFHITKEEAISKGVRRIRAQVT